MIYDHFTPFVIFALEAYGFCKPGEGGPFVEDGRINSTASCRSTRTAATSEAYIHGLPHVIEAVRQLRARRPSRCRAAEIVLSCSSVAQLSAAVVLGKG